MINSLSHAQVVSGLKTLDAYQVGGSLKQFRLEVISSLFEAAFSTLAFGDLGTKVDEAAVINLEIPKALKGLLRVRMTLSTQKKEEEATRVLQVYQSFQNRFDERERQQLIKATMASTSSSSAASLYVGEGESVAVPPEIVETPPTLRAVKEPTPIVSTILMNPESVNPHGSLKANRGGLLAFFGACLGMGHGDYDKVKDE